MQANIILQIKLVPCIVYNLNVPPSVLLMVIPFLILMQVMAFYLSHFNQ